MVQLTWALLALTQFCLTIQALLLPNDVLDTRATNDTDTPDTPLSVQCIRSLIKGYPLVPAPGDWVTALASIMHNRQVSGNCDYFDETYDPGNKGLYIYSRIVPSSTSGDCKSTAEVGTDVNGLTSAVNQIRNGGASAGCCALRHGQGTWHANAKFKTGKYISWTSITCP